jgi:hypothetical protein
MWEMSTGKDQPILVREHLAATLAQLICAQLMCEELMCEQLKCEQHK